ncbi:transcriptional repressor [Tenacibaculum aestuariivivum]|uniref:transcriptional repressor n=1 Tax=Tenacibaculum aestuariivivum TaxID=2006131 RepID=UPI003AB68D2F
MQLNSVSFYYICNMGVIRKTKSVKIIIEQFEKSSSAIPVTILVENLSNLMNKTTIYRILNKLEEDGVLHSFLGNKGNKWYAKCNGCTSTVHHDVHPHFQCLNCNKIDCLTIDIVIPKIKNRKIQISQVLLQGTCEECSNSNF